LLYAPMGMNSDDIVKSMKHDESGTLV
jgi:hypothetical protein